MTYIGIDISKDTFVVAYSPNKNSKTKTFKNTTKGIHEFIKTISKEEHHCVMEATGNYSALLVYLLSEAGITTSLENPLKVKNFARAMLSTVKTDEIDARLIALYGEKMNPAPYKMRSDAILTLKQKRTVIRQLKKQLIATRNLKGSMEALPFFDAKCKRSVEEDHCIPREADKRPRRGSCKPCMFRVQEADGPTHLNKGDWCHSCSCTNNNYWRLHIL